MIYPNVIIAGASKCGTTSVFKYLSDHPQVCGSSAKETYFLMDPECPLYEPERNYHTQGLEGYHYFFQHCKKADAKIWLEATPDYMHQKTPLEVLPTLATPPTIFFILRNPSKRVFSLYQFAKNNLGILSKDISFSTFVKRIKSNNDFTFSRRPILRNAIAHSKYINYLENWIQYFGIAHIHVFLFEDLRSSPKIFMMNICNRLGINESFYTDYCFKKKNVTYGVRNQELHRRKKMMASNLPSIFQWAPLRKGLGYLYQALNTQYGKINITEEDHKALDALAKDFEPYNTALAELFELDLSSWSQ